MPAFPSLPPAGGIAALLFLSAFAHHQLQALPRQRHRGPHGARACGQPQRHLPLPAAGTGCAQPAGGGGCARARRRHQCAGTGARAGGAEHGRGLERCAARALHGPAAGPDARQPAAPLDGGRAARAARQAHRHRHGPAPAALGRAAEVAQEVVPTFDVAIADGAYTTEFTVPQRITVPSGGQRVTLALGSYTAPAARGSDTTSALASQSTPS